MDEMKNEEPYKNKYGFGKISWILVNYFPSLLISVLTLTILLLDKPSFPDNIVYYFMVGLGITFTIIQLIRDTITYNGHDIIGDVIIYRK